MKPTAAAAIAACAKHPKTQRTRVVLPPRAVPSPRRRGQVDVADSSNPIIARPTGYYMPVSPAWCAFGPAILIWNSVVLLFSLFPGAREDCPPHIMTRPGIPRALFLIRLSVSSSSLFRLLLFPTVACLGCVGRCAVQYIVHDCLFWCCLPVVLVLVLS